jgi:beta-lysine 5,6-aminomutase alpha subunit
VNLAKQHTTVSVERAVLRLAGLTGADSDGLPWVNRLADTVRADVGLEHGLALPVWDALVRGEAEDLSVLAQKAATGSVTFCLRGATAYGPVLLPGRPRRQGCERWTPGGVSAIG